MRIIAGRYGSRKLKTLDGLDTRPTSDKIRGAVFNILTQKIPGAMVLDLFAGCGAVGLEAVSRGARFAVLNDISQRSIDVIQDNIDALGAGEEIGVMGEDAFDAVGILAGSGMAFDIIYLDPPYDSQFYEQIIRRIRECGILALGGVIVCEHRKGSSFDLPFDYRIYDRRIYGKSAVSFVIEEIVA
jgi:16S rRNA (guanine966-N2)-methyltransferase